MKFQCQESCGGKCCKVPNGQQLFIFLTKQDRFKLAAFLKMPVNKFAHRSHFRSTRFGGSGWQWHIKRSGSECRFFRNGRCSVYEARPTQCRTWPFWPEIVTNPDHLKVVAKECPGLGQGEELLETEVQAQVAEQVKADGQYSNQGG